MKSRQLMYIVVVLLMSIFVLWGCPKKAEVTSAPEPQKEAAAEPAKEEPKVEQKAEPATQPEAAPAAKEEQPQETCRGSINRTAADLL